MYQVRDVRVELGYKNHTGQKNCSIKDEDELAQIIGKYRMTSDLHWIDFKSNGDYQMKETVIKKDSYSSDSLEEFREESISPDIDTNKTSSEDNFELDMNNEKSLSQTSSDFSSVHDNNSITSHYSFEIVEETEALQTEDITESIDIRISPRNSTVMSFNCSNNFYSEFSLVANVEIQDPAPAGVLDSTETTTEFQKIDMNDNEVPKKDDQTATIGNLIDFESTDINANGCLNEANYSNSCIVNKDANSSINEDNYGDNCILEDAKSSINEDDYVKSCINEDNYANSCLNEDNNVITFIKEGNYANSCMNDEKYELCEENVSQHTNINIMDAVPMDNTPNGKKTKYYASKIEITKQEKIVVSSVEKKIAEEIKEMKQREEEIRAMREKLAKEMSEKAMNKPAYAEPPVIVKSDKSESSPPNSVEKPKIKKTEATKVANSYIQACVFAVKRKDVSIKSDTSETNPKPPSANIQQESPVEREIRIAKEREEELKREREQALKCKMEMDFLNSEGNSVAETDVDSALSICSDSSFDSVTKLAPLFPATGSPEESNSNGISVYSSSAGSLCSLESLSQRERQNVGSMHTGVNGTFLSPSPDSAYCKPGFPFSPPKGNGEKRNKIDMERFISSKGKEIKFKGDSCHNIGFSSFYEIRPPQIKKGEEMACKRFITAAAKIQNELKEMQEREEQLKKERENILQEIKNIEILEEKGEPVKETNPSESQTSPVLQMDSPNSFETTEKNNVKKQDNSAYPARRRSILIDEWEQRIQKSISQP